MNALRFKLSSPLVSTQISGKPLGSHNRNLNLASYADPSHVDGHYNSISWPCLVPLLEASDRVDLLGVIEMRESANAMMSRFGYRRARVTRQIGGVVQCSRFILQQARWGLFPRINDLNPVANGAGSAESEVRRGGVTESM